MADLVAIILAAGKGTRMKSKLPKVLHKVGGKPMVEHVMEAAEEAGVSRKIVVVGFGSEKVMEFIGGRAKVVLQAEQLGTGHAVLQAEPALQGKKGTALILCGDTPLLVGEELEKFCQAHKASGAAVSVLTAKTATPFGYGRIVRDKDGNVEKIVEEKDATEAEKTITEINTGIYCLEYPLAFQLLHSLSTNNAQGEYYLTDILTKCREQGEKVAGILTEDFSMVMGINSRKQLAEAEGIMRERILDKLMGEGVSIMDPASTFIEASVKIGRDTVIYPFTWLEGKTVIGEDCEIGPNVRLQNVEIGDGNHIQFTYGHECKVENNVTMGPYIHLRPNTLIHDKVKIGNFVEVKNSTVGVGTKLPHLTYIGDSDIGGGVNMGCGCITVNYNGKKKYRTIIEDDAFVGCNSNLVAPVKVGKGSYVAAGSTITKDVPENSLGVGRGRQVNIDGWAEKYRQK